MPLAAAATALESEVEAEGGDGMFASVAGEEGDHDAAATVVGGGGDGSSEATVLL